ncbi:hypothetical protein Glove_320g26 [Diversispora epigaea]|uniref:Serine-threonine/tyrosine-protein kinase catalytic domain-containing protein n=1 Tax=Diversispora epigaea TaxID=1348612 RepID=A0A397HP94_9GLOM|nr:hypothetical protein Glove_320g26 [Diversispora epigaea]
MESLSNVDLLNNIIKRKREMVIPGTPPEYQEIYTDCWKHNGNSRPDISLVVKNLSKIIISDDAGFENPQSRIHIQNEELKVHSNHPTVNKSAGFEVFINDLFEHFIDVFKKQFTESQPIMMKNYIKKREKNPVKVLFEMLSYPSHSWFTSMIGFFYMNGIGTVTDNQMAVEFCSIAANEIIHVSTNSPSLMKLYHTNKEIGTMILAEMYLEGTEVADCYIDGLGVEKNQEKAFELYLKSAEKGIPIGQNNVGWCYINGIGTPKNTAKGFVWNMKSALAGNINAIHDVGHCYSNGIYVDKDYQTGFRWCLKAAEKGVLDVQCYLGNCYERGLGIDVDQVKAFEWYKKAAKSIRKIVTTKILCDTKNATLCKMGDTKFPITLVLFITICKILYDHKVVNLSLNSSNIICKKKQIFTNLEY